MGRHSGRTALVTGAARGQGRAHAVALAESGASIIAVDACADIETIPYRLSTRDDLLETERLVTEAGSRVVTAEVDVRDGDGMNRVVADALEVFGGVDICVANAGVVGFGKIWELTDTQWATMIDVNLTGVFNTLRAVAPTMMERGFGRIVTVASMGGRSGTPNLGHYSAAKWGVIGLTKSLALEAAGTGVTVNAVCPGTVSTDMVHNQAMYSLFAPELDAPTMNQVEGRYAGLNPMHVPWSAPEEVTGAVLYLCSDSARHVTGTTLEISAGVSARLP
jgi:SDR family mycofactocin-dependent oxidoreductase